MNPHLNADFAKPETLAGVWRHGHSAFELSADGTWRCLETRGDELPCGGAIAKGRWRTNDYHVSFFSSSGTGFTQLQALTYRGVHRLVQPFEDPDEWNGDLGYERAAPE